MNKRTASFAVYAECESDGQFKGLEEIPLSNILKEYPWDEEGVAHVFYRDARGRYASLGFLEKIACYIGG